jgi:hypothetical protein
MKLPYPSPPFLIELPQSFLYGFPIDILGKSFNVICPLQSIIDHKGMLKNIQNQIRYATSRMSHIV